MSSISRNTRTGQTPAVVLASGSAYRHQLLSRLLPAFIVDVPGIDEAPAPGEAPAATASRLARAKAAAVAARHPLAVVIGSDQVAACGDLRLGKPGGRLRAIEQLGQCAGRQLLLHTAVCVIGPGANSLSEHRDDTRLQFRQLSADAIERYVERERPYDCAGSFKFESLGIALFSAVTTRDPSAIQGLPLIWLADALPRHGVSVL
ncbi:MAG: septum formation inhibitor Maf [Gammaproteobacteria bacterium]|nr:septum formation inhibitor Maf [Gammaproteobacteria bacterium]